MTFWPPLEILGFVRKAGFTNDQAHLATGLVLASSDGADHHHWCPESTPGVDQRGLFALDVRRCDPDQPDSLFDPLTNCEWTHALFTHYGRTWDWHPVWHATSGRVVKAVLAALDEDKGWMNRPGVFYGRTRHLHRAPGTSHEVWGAVADALVTSPVEDQTLWPPTTPSPTSDRPAP